VRQDLYTINISAVSNVVHQSVSQPVHMNFDSAPHRRGQRRLTMDVKDLGYQLNN